ncbi:MAG: NADH:ubiquinone oxidoreductase [Bacillota bacterium]|nr:NADH:ubiquinone oxidoreductase [Bacillota bacterium]
MKPRVGIYGLTSCAGDQLVLLNCEDELLDIVAAVDLRSFVMAQSDPAETELDVAFVEGAVAQLRDLRMLQDIRQRAALLVAIGTCATWGGIPALTGENEVAGAKRRVYGSGIKAKPGFFENLPPTPLSRHVKVDLAVPGCPIEPEQLLTGLASLLHGDLPRLPKYPVCAECKMKENSCLLVRDGAACLGPLTVAGCGARCPSLNRPCMGCRGPIEEANYFAEYRRLMELGHDPKEIRLRLQTFAAPAAALEA